MTKTSSFGVSGREGHNSDEFYARNMTPRFKPQPPPAPNYTGDRSWANQIYCADASSMTDVPDRSVGLAFTSPPYNVAKEYDEDLTLGEYLDGIAAVGEQVYDKLVYGGRYVVNVANLGRSPYLSLVSHFQILHQRLGFLPMGEIIWIKAAGASGSCAWGSFQSSSAPRLRDVHEYLLVFAKESFGRGKGESTISKEDFMRDTLSVWHVRPESAKRVGHPAPFPVALAKRVIDLYSFKDDVVLDPYIGSGTVALAARDLGRSYVGYDISAEYVALAERRLSI